MTDSVGEPLMTARGGGYRPAIARLQDCLGGAPPAWACSPWPGLADGAALIGARQRRANREMRYQPAFRGGRASTPPPCRAIRSGPAANRAGTP